jgi:hypothetical protein
MKDHFSWRSAGFKILSPREAETKRLFRLDGEMSNHRADRAASQRSVSADQGKGIKRLQKARYSNASKLLATFLKMITRILRSFFYGLNRSFVLLAKSMLSKSPLILFNIPARERITLN